MQEVYSFIQRVAPARSAVLICGESGTGKELAAHAIHVNSPRAAQPFVPINCAALTETLLESELFGHEKGAFTGAINKKDGKLAVANGGTVFLDEIGEMPLSMQSRLLRFLRITRLNGSAARGRSNWMCVSWRPRIAIWKKRSRPASFALTCITVWTS
jgi:transcriptional regulator with PAS, ATPase and Fis domain